MLGAPARFVTFGCRYLGICTYAARPTSELMLLWTDAQKGDGTT